MEAIELNSDDTFLLENLKAAFSFAHLALRSMVLANGVALTAILGFYGNVFGSGAQSQIDLGFAATCFVWGLILALAATVLAYAAQLCFAEEVKVSMTGQATLSRTELSSDVRKKTEKRMKRWLWIAGLMRVATLATVIAAGGSFFVGAYGVQVALTGQTVTDNRVGSGAESRMENESSEAQTVQ
ncbi:hypothetical protein GTQ45_09610 [Pyruvatibacter mobilis]|uniref:Transmembrane protein n=1 Tax=Pyruvatibacter mobilis TaxID=1712261 RepID=A0A845QCP0_9HYPH|nr:hypothetical protein [Pyruvatibacter mobilis]NBG95986.1 hypothetical protein [Pyruvatibacter mobilis]QJD75109.1 hypothetical protein HG718_06660 [Pyruvatibacter mobilis]